jgi:hypothetical protein
LKERIEDEKIGRFFTLNGLKLLVGLMEEMSEKCKLVGMEDEKVKIAELIEREFGLDVYEPELLSEDKVAVVMDEGCKVYLYIPF